MFYVAVLVDNSKCKDIDIFDSKCKMLLISIRKASSDVIFNVCPNELGVHENRIT